MQENTESQDESKKETIHQIYDSILKRILVLSNVAVINLINSLFDRNFPVDSKITYNMTESVNDKFGKTLSDTILTIHVKDEIYKFHIEVEISPDDTNDISIVLRMFDYGYRDALRHKEKKDDKITIKFPKSLIILLEHNSNSPANVILELDFDEQGTFNYSVPTMKFLDHSLDELNQQKMVILLPLYLLKLRRKIDNAKKQKRNKNAVRENAKALKDLINSILNAIEENAKTGNIDSYDAYLLNEMVNTLYGHLYADIKEFEEEGVRNMLADKLVFEADKLVFKYEEKLMRAREEAIKEKLESAKNFLEMGLSPENVAKAMKLPIEKIMNLQAEQTHIS